MRAKQWEYLVEPLPPITRMQVWLDDLGQDGWELVCICNDDRGSVAPYAVFKRPDFDITGEAQYGAFHR